MSKRLQSSATPELTPKDKKILRIRFGIEIDAPPEPRRIAEAIPPNMPSPAAKQ